MTYEEREELLAKDYLTIADIQRLLGLEYHYAAKVIRDIRRKTDRLGIQGMVHVQDYIDYFDLDITRYVLGTVAVAKGELTRVEKAEQLPEEPLKPVQRESIPLIRSSQYEQKRA